MPGLAEPLAPLLYSVAPLSWACSECRKFSGAVH